MSKPLKIKKVAAADPIRLAAVRILRRRLKEFYSHWPNPQDTPTRAQLHNLRISGKRLRYSAEQLRELYPDRLALLIDLLKRGQDLLGEFQDCVTQRAVIEAELSKARQRKPDEAATLERLRRKYEKRQQKLFLEFQEIWQGMARPEFRASLKAMVMIQPETILPDGPCRPDTTPPESPKEKNFEREGGKAFPSGPGSE
jgi:CHAD domain-containing protein